MNTIKLNNKSVVIHQGETILDVAKREGLSIPTMCHTEKLSPEPSCMVCVVKDVKRNTFIPSCASVALPKMEIVTDSEDVLAARKTALELLLSDHVGDCYAPCQRICPAGMDIPGMNRLVAMGKFAEANQLVKQHIPLPVTLGYVCPAPCEKGCRRKTVDDTIGICRIKRFAGDQDLNSANPWLPTIEKERVETVLVIGGGATGLTAAWYLRANGYQVTLIESKDKLGGTLLDVDEALMPEGVIEKEANLIQELGVTVQLNKTITTSELDESTSKFNAVAVCSGDKSFERKEGSNKVDNLFFAGSVVRPLKMAVQAVGKGKDIAEEIDRYLAKGETATKWFNSSFGKLSLLEAVEYKKEAENKSVIQKESWLEPFSVEEAKQEAARCLHCDCRAKESCVLQELSTQYNCNQKRYFGERKFVIKETSHSDIIFEQEKCIKCGICIRLAEKHGETKGISFSGRGYNVHIEAALFENIKEAITIAPKEIADACPTGAISKK